MQNKHKEQICLLNSQHQQQIEAVNKDISDLTNTHSTNINNLKIDYDAKISELLNKHRD